MNKEQEKQYIENLGLECPHCGADDLDGGPLNAEAGEVWQEVWCESCEKEWIDVYKLSHVESRENESEVEKETT